MINAINGKDDWHIINPYILDILEHVASFENVSFSFVHSMLIFVGIRMAKF